MRAKQVERILPGACPGADGERVGGMCVRRGDVAPEVGQAALQPGEGLRQLAEAAAGQVLLVGMVLFQEGEALSSASAWARVSTAGLPEAIALTSA